MLSEVQENRDRKFIHLAWTLATDLPSVAGAKVCAILVNKNYPVAFGVNQRKTHPLQAKFAKRKDAIEIHAEIDAIVNVSRSLAKDEFKKLTLYVARSKKVSSRDPTPLFGLSKPCIGCQRAIIAFGFKRVVYTLDDEGFVEL